MVGGRGGSCRKIDFIIKRDFGGGCWWWGFHVFGGGGGNGRVCRGGRVRALNTFGSFGETFC